MKRRLLNQMASEWRSNIWLVTELTIVLIVIQFLFGMLFQVYDWQKGRQGYDLSELYALDVEQLDENSPDYVPSSDRKSSRRDLNVLLSTLSGNPYVEIAAPIGDNGLPYSLSYWGSTFMIEVADSVYECSANMRTLSPDAIRAMRIEGINGETPDQLAEVLERGEIILCPPDKDYASDPSFDYSEIVGQETDNDSKRNYRIGALAHGIRRSDYEPLKDAVAYLPVTGSYDNILVRVKPGRGNDFVESMQDERLRVGNMEVVAIRDVSDMRRRVNLKETELIRNVTVCALFLLLVIFLGFLGTFWFRTRQRAGEIAIRKVNGATNGDIFRRLIGEGLIMMLIATVIATPVLFLFKPLEMYGEIMRHAVNASSIVYGIAAALVVMSLLVVAGVWIPARRATRIDPAYTLADQ